MPITVSAARELVARPAGMDAGQAGEFIALLMTGTVSAEDGAGLLVALAERGETGTEVAAVVRALLARALPVPVSGPCLDLCGTGGSGLTRFNVSTTAAFILAAAGVPVAKHGNRGSQRANGSFDLLDALAVPFALSGDRLAELHRGSGLCFLFARALHPAVAAVAPMRKLAKRRTIFNLAGPLANPCRPRCQVIGVSDERCARTLAAAVAELGVARACVVRGEPGIDEFSVVGTSRWLLVEDGVITAGETPARHPGLDHAALPGGDAAENAALFARLIAGENLGALRDMVVLNAGVALDLWHGRRPAADGPGVVEAARLLASGSVAERVDLHRRLAGELARG